MPALGSSAVAGGSLGVYFQLIGKIISTFAVDNKVPGLEDLSHPTLEANIPKTAFSSPKVNLGSSYAGRNVGMFLDRILDTCGSGGKKAHTDMVIAQRHLGQDLCQVNEIHPQPSTLVQSTGCDLQEGTAGRQLHKDDTLQVATS